jgi:coenzyme F420-reducing hydrogenase delta subunit/NAD-dependent dihydropyrimidine dehydrogenase PreA subunit
MAPAPVLILGNSECSWRIAAQLAAAGVPVAAAMREAAPSAAGAAVLAACGAGIETLAGARLLALAGGAGGFTAAFAAAGRRVHRAASAVVVAEEGRREPLFSAYGLAPSASVVPISAFDPRRPPAGASAALFLSGLAGESEPAMAAEMMAAALALQRQGGVQSIVLAGNLKVAADGVETLSQEARAAGVLFFKFQRTRPRFQIRGDGGLEVAFTDELIGEPFTAAPGLTVVDEAFRPPAGAAELAAALGIETDAAGFLQADNVRREPLFTNRRAVFVAGGSRAGGLDPGAEAAAAAIEILAALGAGAGPPGASAAIDPGRCIRCLTCLRICPHRAVALNGRPAILPAACERCGLCAAECPRGAIALAGMEAHALGDRLAAWPASGRRPRIAAFCCRKSALIAAREAAACGGPPAVEVIEVPCAGALPTEWILAAFNRGADGVLVLACHEELCHSAVGNRFARARAEAAAARLAPAGVPPGRLAYRTLAANMAAGFEAVVAEFSRSLTPPAPGRATAKEKP